MMWAWHGGRRRYGWGVPEEKKKLRPTAMVFLWLTLPLYLLDQATKWWAVSRFSEPDPGRFSTFDEKVTVIDGFLWWTRVHNQGVAFGLGNGTAWAPYVFLVVLVVALGAVSYFWRKGEFSTVGMRLAAALLIAGILGNLTDRLFQGFWLERWSEAGFFERLSKGYVVDFIDVRLPFYGHWPTFNVADACISVAAVLLLIETIRTEVAAKRRPASAPSA